MIDKNDFTVYRKYEGDRRYYNYNFDMIKDELLKAVEGLIVEDKVVDYIVDIENIIEQVTEELNDTKTQLEDLQTSYEDLEWDYNSLKEDYKGLENRYDELYEEKEELLTRIQFGLED